MSYSGFSVVGLQAFARCRATSIVCTHGLPVRARANVQIPKGAATAAVPRLARLLEAASAHPRSWPWDDLSDAIPDRICDQLHLVRHSGFEPRMITGQTRTNFAAELSEEEWP